MDSVRGFFHSDVPRSSTEPCSSSPASLPSPRLSHLLPWWQMSLPASRLPPTPHADTRLTSHLLVLLPLGPPASRASLLPVAALLSLLQFPVPAVPCLTLPPWLCPTYSTGRNLDTGSSHLHAFSGSPYPSLTPCYSTL